MTDVQAPARDGRASSDPTLPDPARPDQALALLPGETVRLLDPSGTYLGGHGSAEPPSPDRLRELYAALVVGRRFDREATALVKQGRLAVYPSSYGQEACQVGAALALQPADWLFPTYRDCVALVARGVDPVETLTLLRGDWHCGYDPHEHRCAPQCTPIATHAPHAVGFTFAARRRGEDTAAVVLLGDGATSEGDFHEALNFAAVNTSPVVFLIQNNQYALSVPLRLQTRAPSLAHKGIGYGVPGQVIDGNDVLAVYGAVSAALERARRGEGPTLIEAMTYRMDPHTNADDARRYREDAEVAAWRDRDPLARFEAYLRRTGGLDDEVAAEVSGRADEMAAGLRARMADEPAGDPGELFAHVYATPTPQLREQARMVAEEAEQQADDADEG